MIDAATLESDEGRWVLVLEDDFGTHSFHVDPEMVEIALQPWRDYVLEGEIVRREFEASGRVSWDEYRASQERTDPEWADALIDSVDMLRKRDREGAMMDPGDISDAA